MLEGSVLPFDYPDFYIVVSQEMFAEVAPLTYKVYEVENEKTAEETSKKVNKISGKDFQVSSSFYTDYKEGKEGIVGNLTPNEPLQMQRLIFRCGFMNQEVLGLMEDA
jgi:putative ABC transport system permease protein